MNIRKDFEEFLKYLTGEKVEFVISEDFLKN
jgi:hypothetical protein